MKFNFGLTTFRWKYYKLAFGGYGGYGNSHEWLGIKLKIFKAE